MTRRLNFVTWRSEQRMRLTSASRALSLLMGVTGTAGGIAHFAHLGGMLFGWLLIRYWRGQPPFAQKRQGPWGV